MENILKEFDYLRSRNWIQQFSNFRTQDFEKLLRTKPESFWHEEGEKRALQLFHSAAERVPAYKAFLKKHKISHIKIRTIGDFKKVPLTHKKNYIHAYPLEERCWDGDVSKSTLVAMSSGTTGEPTFWPRGGFQEFEASVTHELLYRYLFEVRTRKTLLIVGFPMGVYISGIATVLPSWLVSEKGYDMTLVTVGTSKDEILRAVDSLQENYEQVVLVGHPFFIKDVVETGKEKGIAWEKKRLRMMFCSEGFSEEWRKYVVENAGASYAWDSALSTYGSSELLLMAYETPLSVFVRNTLVAEVKLRNQLYLRQSEPSLFQYNPFLRYIETVRGELVFTSASGIPLIRYNLRDSGRILPFEKVESVLEQYDRNWQKTFLKYRKTEPLWKLPFLAMWGRSDQTAVFYAANIYPEHIRQCLDAKAFYRKLTGKFTMRKDYRKNMEEFLEINIELRSHVEPNEALAKKIQNHVVEYLRKLNLEYLDMSEREGGKAHPRIKLWPYQHPKYFKPGVKPKFIAS